MCVDRGKFKVFGIADCWRRGLQAVTFAEIDKLEFRRLDDVSDRTGQVTGVHAFALWLAAPAEGGGATGQSGEGRRRRVGPGANCVFSRLCAEIPGQLEPGAPA